MLLFFCRVFMWPQRRRICLKGNWRLVRSYPDYIKKCCLPYFYDIDRCGAAAPHCVRYFGAKQ
jgi:hypothetical protein